MAEKYERGSSAIGAPGATAPKPPPPPRKSIARRRTTSSNNTRRNNSLRNRSTGSSGNGRRTTNSQSTPKAPTGNTKVIAPPAPPPPPKPPTNAAYLGSDTTYQRQSAAYKKALADFQAEQGLSRTDYDTGYQNTRRDIGLSKADAAEDLQNDYASRGLLRSSLYNTDLGELNQQYQNQYTDLDKQRTAFFDQLMQQLTGFKNEQATQQQNAMAEALRRKAEKYNL